MLQNTLRHLLVNLCIKLNLFSFPHSPRGSGRQGQVVTDHRVSLPPSGHSTLTRHQINQVIPNLHLPRPAQSPPPPYEPRLVFPVLKKSGDLGVR